MDAQTTMHLPRYSTCVLVLGFIVITTTSGYCISHLDNREYDGLCGKLSVPLTSGTIHIPWAATVHVYTDRNSHLDAATIITPTLVLMNANRFKNGTKLQFFKFSNYFVSGNLTSYYDVHDNNTAVQTVEIMHIRIHPAYSVVDWEYVQGDLAAIHLKTPLVFDKMVHSICIPTQEIVESILRKSADPATQNSSSVLYSGWGTPSEPQLTFLNVHVNSQSLCEMWWKQRFETHDAPYDGRFCVNVTKDNLHTQCIHRDNGVVGEYTGQFYWLGYVNNYYSDHYVCDSLTRIFVCETTLSLSKFINDNIRCGPTKFTCDNGSCIDINRFCDGIPDCTEDGSDETNLVCRAFIRDSTVTICSHNQFRCGLFGKCIPKGKVCDGKIDCPDGEDENNCKCICNGGPGCGVPVVLTISVVGLLIGGGIVVFKLVVRRRNYQRFYGQHFD